MNDSRVKYSSESGDIMAVRKSRSKEKTVLFEITTARPLPIGQQVFVSGNQPMLGDWKPDGLPLTRMDDNTWAASAIIDPNVPLEFKVTRGTWETEALGESGAIPTNTTVAAGRSRIVGTVHRWRDDA
jgi:hypothetical protein